MDTERHLRESSVKIGIKYKDSPISDRRLAQIVEYFSQFSPGITDRPLSKNWQGFLDTIDKQKIKL
jgi:hypothetical protein